MAPLLILIMFALVVISLTAVINVPLLSRIGQRSGDVTALPPISVLIPARNEAEVIGDTICALLAQDYPALEVILLDDNSTDGTAQIALEAGAGAVNLNVVQGKPLPPGWGGKNWACQQLSEAATHDWLVFTDADVIWCPGALRDLMREALATEADLLTVWPTQQTETVGERLVVPLMAFVILGYLPLLAVHRTSVVAFAAANGQCMAFKRRIYEQIGGHAAVKDAIVEDIQLARRVKASGFRLRMADGAGQIRCRMYRNWGDVLNGYAKNIIAGYGDSVLALFAATLFHWLLFLGPWGLLFTEWRIWGIAMIALGMLTRALTAAATQQRILDALLMPLSVLLMTRIAAQAVWWRWRYGGPRWKGRTLIRDKATGGANG